MECVGPSQMAFVFMVLLFVVFASLLYFFSHDIPSLGMYAVSLVIAGLILITGLNLVNGFGGAYLCRLSEIKTATVHSRHGNRGQHYWPLNLTDDQGVTSMGIILVLSIIVVFGSFGGYLSTILRPDVETDALPEALAIGVGASFLVPMMLNLADSAMFIKVCSYQINTNEVHEYFVLAGLCLLAGVCSRSMIENMTSVMLDQIRRSTDQVKEEVAQETNTLKDIMIGNEIDTTEESTSSCALEASERLLLKAIGDSRHRFRTEQGLSRETQQSEIAIFSHLCSLKEKSLIDSVPYHEKEAWYLTTAGKSQYQRMREED